jgi:hypothetical protein
MLRLELQPLWVRFPLHGLLAVFACAVAGVAMRSPSESIGSKVGVAVVIGVIVAAITTYSTRQSHAALNGAVTGLDRTQRSQAIAAVTRGVVPADQRVRCSAVRLGQAYLGHKSADQLKHQQRGAWVVLAFVVAFIVAIGVLAAASRLWLIDLYLLATVLFIVVAQQLGVSLTRRIHRNVSLLAGPR